MLLLPMGLVPAISLVRPTRLTEASTIRFAVRSVPSCRPTRAHAAPRCARGEPVSPNSVYCCRIDSAAALALLLSVLSLSLFVVPAADNTFRRLPRRRRRRFGASSDLFQQGTVRCSQGCHSPHIHNVKRSEFTGSLQSTRYRLHLSSVTHRCAVSHPDPQRGHCFAM